MALFFALYFGIPIVVGAVGMVVLMLIDRNKKPLPPNVEANGAASAPVQRPVGRLNNEQGDKL